MTSLLAVGLWGLLAHDGAAFTLGETQAAMGTAKTLTTSGGSSALAGRKSATAKLDSVSKPRASAGALGAAAGKPRGATGWAAGGSSGRGREGSTSRAWASAAGAGRGGSAASSGHGWAQGGEGHRTHTPRR